MNRPNSHKTPPPSDPAVLRKSSKPSLAYVDGKVVPLGEAKIPIIDNGFLLGDGVFETMRTTRSGQLFRPDLHMARMEHGLDKLMLNRDANFQKQVLAAAEELRSEAIKQIGNELYIRINVSSGSSQDWSNQKLTITGIAKPIPEQKLTGLICISWKHHGHPHELSDVKSLSYARSSTLRRKAAQSNVDDVIVVAPDNNVVEASISNLIARKGNVVFAPGANAGALPGTTRHIVVNELLDKAMLDLRKQADSSGRDSSDSEVILSEGEVASATSRKEKSVLNARARSEEVGSLRKSSGYNVEETLPLDTLYDCDEVMLTSSVAGVRKVDQIDNTNYLERDLFDILFADFNLLLD